jgi:hypothetical protein
MKDRRGDVVDSLAIDPVFRPLYDRMMDAITVPLKRKLLHECLDWLWINKGIDIEPEPDPEMASQETDSNSEISVEDIKRLRNAKERTTP